MIIACPACSTRYVVPDSAIGVEGRTVRCAKCKHSWFQDGPELELSETQAVVEPAGKVRPPPPPPEHNPAAAEDEGEASATGARPAADPEAQRRPAPAEPSPPEPDEGYDEEREEAGALEGPPPVQDVAPSLPPMPEPDPDYSAFDREPPFRPRRNPLKIWTAAAAVFAAIAAATIAAVSYYGLPDWVPVSQPTFGLDQPDLVLDFPADQQDRRTLPNGSILFAVSGTITNVGRETQRVPNVLIVLFDASGNRVFRWEVVPPAQSLAPGESVTINEANNEVPKRARSARIGWSPS
ncbi:MJ0042-type zinc finger domain-containing protein [Erythrobacter litoralis]|uniref:Zinc finger/thioredoxin putative domain-containing protein n=1 Tax=Erythrobacter litoralis (strain HTCC2594) TaxID=314225 RepID=Q2N7G0_ERYLH|nr:MJ0042-type zinc finger domain-containing protein [Erythrobacter litoralis]ABC64381.1 hypothetical protein ELI_11445 [Erythrobacter litoralis HTCC2594]